MDANGLRFWMLADEAHWRLEGDPPGLAWSPRLRGLRLASRRALPEPAELPVDARQVVERPPGAVDLFGSRVFWDATAEAVRVRSEDLPDGVTLFMPPAGQVPSDLATGAGGILYLAVGGRVVLLDPQERWDNRPVEPVGPGGEEIAAWRLAALPEGESLASREGLAGGVWVLDRENRRLAHLRGRPLPRRPGAVYDAGTFRPDPEEPDAPRFDRVLDLEGDLGFDAGEEPAALAAGPGGRLALVSWDEQDGGHLRLGDADGRFAPPLRLLHGPEQPLVLPYSLVWLSQARLAVLVAGLAEAPAFDLPAEDGGEQTTLLPAGDLYPLPDHDGGPFFAQPADLLETGAAGEVDGELVPFYPASGETGDARSLHRLSLPSFARAGTALSARPVDSGREGTVWHRLYLEAVLPPHGAVRVFVTADDDDELPEGPWFEHRFGSVAGAPGQPAVRGVWVPQPSELPFHPGLLCTPPQPGRAGLFTALVQRAGRRVTALVGRYLWVRVELVGDGRTTPELAALRVWGSRFSYRDRYLPSLYGEQLFGDDADAVLAPGEPTTAADFLERFLDNFEGILTPLEDRIASAHLLTDPATVPAASLPWLGSWIGVTFEPGLGEERRRELLRATPEVQRWHGTRRGLGLALELATGGGVSGGEVVILEDFRLRRTFATILGADLADEDDPLLAGLVESGNSFVGDTLILGDDYRRELLALFDLDTIGSLSRFEQQAAADFFERLAHRVTVLVHQQVAAQDLGLIRRVAEAAAPAHVEVRVVTASYPFIVGLASLVGVDSYLARRRGLRPVQVDGSRLGSGDLLLRPPSLDPRLGGGSAFRDDLSPGPSQEETL